MTLRPIVANDLPGIFQSADTSSKKSQKLYFLSLKFYLITLISIALISYLSPQNTFSAFLSAILFFITLGILIFLKVKKPDSVWYDSRTLAESIKTRSWRWMMKAEPYENTDTTLSSKKFIDDLKSILDQHVNLANFLEPSSGITDPITEYMHECRKLPLKDRINLYLRYRINDQANFYSNLSIKNKLLANRWFWASVFLHSFAIFLLLVVIYDSTLNLPIEALTTAAGTIITWLQAKKHNELHTSYSFTAHEITLIKGEALSIASEPEFSEFVINSENAFSKEHTQWAARKAT